MRMKPSAEDRRDMKKRRGGCGVVAGQKARIERKKGGGFSPMGFIKEVMGEVMTYTLAYANALSALLGRLLGAARGLVPIVETMAQQEAAATYTRRMELAGSPLPTPKSFALSYNSTATGGTGGGSQGAQQSAELKPSPKPKPDPAQARDELRRRAERDFGSRTFYSEISAYLDTARTAPAKAVAQLNGARITGAGKQLREFLEKPSRADLYLIDQHVEAIRKRAGCSREEAIEASMDRIMDVVQQRRFNDRERDHRLLMMNQDEDQAPEGADASGAMGLRRK